jgi:hypothetical protein
MIARGASGFGRWIGVMCSGMRGRIGEGDVVDVAGGGGRSEID